MRESIGGTWLFSIVITFIALFSAFLAYAISYTKAFNVKGEILNLIERNEGWTSSTNADLEHLTTELLDADPSVEAQAFKYIKNAGYDYSAVTNYDCGRVDGHVPGSVTKVGGYCVTMYCPNMTTHVGESGATEVDPNSVNAKIYYKVTTFIAFDLPVINLTLTIPVTGETRTLFHDKGDNLLKQNCQKN